MNSFMFSKARSICGSAPSTNLPLAGSSGAITEEKHHAPQLRAHRERVLVRKAGNLDGNARFAHTHVAINCTSMQSGNGA